MAISSRDCQKEEGFIHGMDILSVNKKFHISSRDLKERKEIDRERARAFKLSLKELFEFIECKPLASSCVRVIM